MRRKIPEVQKALSVYVDMFARAADLDREQLQDFLDGYWLLRRLSEDDDAAPTLSLDFRPVSAPEDLIRAIRDEPKSPAEELIEQAAGKATTEGKEPAKKIPDRGSAAAKFKRLVRDRIEELRRENVTLQSIADTCRGTVNPNSILDILEGRKVAYSIYVAVWDGLNRVYP